MTRRQVYFCIPERGTYYVSEEINGDKEEMERMGSSDSCEKNWAEILDGLKNVSTLLQSYTLFVPMQKLV